jgi:DNA-binding NarL/FixJ family response regulator
MPIYRVLLVEDFCTFRRAIRTMLEQHAGFQVVGEAADGNEAIQLAGRLLPDIILLDINLPKLNGFEAMPQILRHSPVSKIVFLTQEPSTEVAEEALRLGAHGYVVKTDAGSELLRALEAITRDQVYLSRQLQERMAGKPRQWPGAKAGTASRAPLVGIKGVPERQSLCGHEVDYYLHDSDFLESLHACVSTALHAGDAVVVLLTRSHQQALCQGLQAMGLKVNDEIRTGRLRLLDADVTVAKYLRDELPDEMRSREEARLLLEAAKKTRRGEHSRVCVFGECVSLLYAKGNGDVVLWLERFWDELCKTHELYVRCWYQVNQQQLEIDWQFFQQVSEEHSAVHSL